MKPIRREIAAQVKVLDEQTGVVEYIASDETIDSYGEVIRANGWRFSRFAKNAQFVDSHRYDQVECLLGKVLDFRVEGRRLIETVQWAIDVPSNQRARIGWDMTRGGYLRAVSVGFQPLRMVSRWDQDKTGWLAQLKETGLHEEQGVRAIYIEQEQLELSAVIIGANPNALIQVGKAFAAGVLREDDLAHLAATLTLSGPASVSASEPASTAPDPGPAVAQANAQARQRFLAQIRKTCGLK
jgi:hypothetical protein